MLKKIKRLIELVFFVILHKENFFRNYILNQNLFSKLSRITYENNPDLIDLLNNLDNLQNSMLKYSKEKPFNSQIVRRNIIDSILKEFQPEVIIETGTFLGSTTEFFSAYANKIKSVEKSELYYLFSKARLNNFKNIELINSDSGEYLKKTNFNNNSYFFYLDAHWGKYLPLKIELEKIFNLKNFIVCIDDFKVPYEERWGYDVYGSVDLSIDSFNFINKKNIFFPNYNFEDETGSKRGCVFIASEGKAENILSNQKLLKKFDNSNNY